MLEAFRAAGWRNRFIVPALRQAASRNYHIAEIPDLMIAVEMWLWAIFFRFSGEYGALSSDKQTRLREEAFKVSFHYYKQAKKGELFEVAQEMESQLGVAAMKIAIGFLHQHIRPTFEHATIAAQKLAPLHEHFDLATLRIVLSQVNIQFIELPGQGPNAGVPDRQHNLKLVTQVAALGQASLYAALTGILIPANIVLVEPDDIPDLIDVFISYARADSAFVTDLAQKISMSGIVAWYDQRIQPDTQFDRVISDQIAASKLVLTIWSSRSVGSKWVRAESLAGFNADKLLQLRIGNCDIPTPFNIVQTIEANEAGLTPQAQTTVLNTIRRKIGAVKEG